MGLRKPLLLIFTTLLCFTTSTLSRTISPATTVLDVDFSRRQILNFGTPSVMTPLSTQKSQFTTTNTTSFSIELHYRDSIFKTQFKDYESLVLSRLDRDSARVNSLHTKLEFKLNDVSRSELKPVDDGTQIRTEDLSTPVMSGTSQGSGEYFTRVGVGSPAKEFYLVLDTGSDVNWIQCEPCTDCYSQTDPIFNPTDSSSYNALSCDSQQCSDLDTSACRSDKCLYQVAYGDGSYTVGEFVTETVSFGNSGNVNNVALGCGHDNEGLFVGAAGLLGLGGGALSLTNQIKATSFSYCLVDRDSSSSSSLDFNSVKLGADSVVAPMMRNSKIDTFYYVGLAGFSVGGQPVTVDQSLFQMDAAGNGGVIVDCGTAITRLQTQAYSSLRDAFKKLTPNLKSTSGVALFDTCYDFSSLTSVKVPTLSFRFAGGKSWDLPAKNYLIPVDSSGTYCFAFAPTTSSMSIIGNVQQQGTRVTFDIANSRVGFAPNSC